MREWLSRREWCDARLVCRGHVFCAHRAVLASVSPYLRLLLKSHSEEDTPTYLVLPDFDLDAMSAVLHYIYNGEVNLPTNRVNSFFDVITTLQIFVDLKSLLNVKTKLEDMHLKYADETLLSNETVGNMECYSSSMKKRYKKEFLKLESQINYLIKRYITVNGKKDEWVPCDDIIDKEIRSRGPTRNELRSRRQRLSVHAENVQVQDEYQEEISPLRDPPGELCPPSGIANGPRAPAAVPVIANEEYRDAESERAACQLITDAVLIRNTENDSMISEVKFSESDKNMANALNERNSHCYAKDNDVSKELNPKNSKFYSKDCAADLLDKKEGNMRLCKDTYSLNSKICPRKSKIENKIKEVHRPNPLRPVPTLLPIRPCDKSLFVRQLPPLLDLTSVHFLPTSLHPAYRENWSPTIQKVDSDFEGDYHNRTEYSKEPGEDGNIRLDSKVFERQIKEAEAVPIQKKSAFNQVLASPWCPRVPYCYRPQPNKISKDSSRRLSVENQVQIESRNEEIKSSSNDRNNNVRTPQSPRDSNQETETCMEPNPHSIAAIMKGDEYKCSVCDKAFADPESLSAHARAHTTVPGAGARHTCSECGKTFSQLRNYKYHVSVHRGTREFAATCSVCGKYFNDRGYLSSHMKIHRNRKEYECPHCPKSFNQRVAYNMHVRIHTGVKPHVCSECGKAFSRKMLLKQHQRTHSGERPYACAVCDKRFADRSNMTLHMRLHSGLKPFACTLCPKSFTKKHHLKTHLNYHTGDKPYSCPRCQLAFSQSSNMRTHLKKCNAPEPGTAT